MSVFEIYKQDGVKFMRPIHTREEYLSKRNSELQRQILKTVRERDARQKNRLIQMNYSCLPNKDGTLKGSKTMSTTVGMDIDHIPKDEMQAVRERILAKKDELGLRMLEESARGEGYHLVFSRRPEMSQEGNLKWASDLLGVEFDKDAKDITRVFFTTTEAELIYLCVISTKRSAWRDLRRFLRPFGSKRQSRVLDYARDDKWGARNDRGKNLPHALSRHTFYGHHQEVLGGE